MGNLFKPVETTLPVKQGFWAKVKGFLTQEINIELTPKQQKMEDEINAFLYQEVTWEKVHNFLFKKKSLGKKKKPEIADVK